MLGVVVEPSDKGVMSFDDESSRLAGGGVDCVLVKEFVAFGSSFLGLVVAVCGWCSSFDCAWVGDS